MDIDAYVARFQEEPGYLDFARLGPIGLSVQEEVAAHLELAARARFGSHDGIASHEARAREAVAAHAGLTARQVVFQPNTTQGLLQAMFGLGGAVALSPDEFPALSFAAQRAADALGQLAPRWIETDHGRVTPGNLREQLDAETTAVAVSLVDYRSGYLADLEGIRQVIGDRLLIVDAAQGFGVVDAPYGLADVIASTGAKWVRAGWGTGFLALSDRALERIRPLWSGPGPEDVDDPPVPPPAPARDGAAAYSAGGADPLAQLRLAVALEEIDAVGVRTISARIAETVSRILDIADEHALPVVSPRAEGERAGIVVLEPEPARLNVLAAALHNHGVTATVRGGRVRLSAHATTSEETLATLRSALLAFSTAVR